jgi:hypothetical protein
MLRAILLEGFQVELERRRAVVDYEQREGASEGCG